MNDRISSLRLFARVARTGSFSRAGREFGLSQPSASRILAKLEQDLGATLFHRTTRAVRLTEAGSDYLQRIQPVLDALDEADHAVRGGDQLSGLLRIGMSSSFGVRELVPRLPAFLERHEALRVDLQVSDERQDLLSDGVDVAFRLGRLDDSALIARKIAESERILVAAPAYLARVGGVDHPAQLESRSLIVGPRAVPTTLEFRAGADPSAVVVHVEGRVTCAHCEGATALACAGVGVSATSSWAVTEELADGRLVRILPDWHLPKVDLHAVFPPGRHIAPAARALVAHMAEALVA